MDRSIHNRPVVRRLFLSALIPLVVLCLHWFAWLAIKPSILFLFFVAVFLSSWIGGLRGGLVAASVCTGAVWYWIIPPTFTFLVQRPMAFASIATVWAVGLLLSFSYDPLREGGKHADRALADVQSVNKPVEAQALEDASDIHRVNMALRETDGRCRIMIGQAVDGIAVMDAGGRYQDANPSFLKMLGYSSEELSQLGIQDLVVKNEQAVISGLLSAASAGPVPLGEWRFVRKDGSIFPVEISFSPLPDGCRLAIVRDIAGRKSAEEEIRSVNSQLKRREEERSLALREANEVLQQRAKELETFNRTMVDRENRIIEMKEEVNALHRELGRQAEYPPLWSQES